MELTQLNQFKTIAEYNSITNAAEKLYVSPSALSQQLRKLETELGVQLFDRTPNSIRLNEYGEIALLHIRHIFSEIDDMKKQIACKIPQHESPFLTAASPFTSVLRYFFSDLNIRDGAASLPVKVSVMSGETIKKNLLSRNIDLGILEKPLLHPRLANTKLLDTFRYISVRPGHPLADKSSVYLSELEGEKLLLPRAYEPGYSLFLNYIRRNNLHFDISFIDDYIMYRNILPTTDQLSECATFTKDFHLSCKRKLILIKDTEMAIPFYCIYLKDNREKFLPFINACTKPGN